MNFVTLPDFTFGEFIKWTLKYNIPRNLILSKDEYDRTFLIRNLIQCMDTVLIVDYANNTSEIIKNRFR